MKINVVNSNEHNEYVIIDNITKKQFDLQSSFDCGQCFRWDQKHLKDLKYQEDNKDKLDKGSFFQGVAMDRYLLMEQQEDHIKLYCSMQEYENLWERYFDMNTDYEEIKEALRYDNVLNRAIDFAPGIRIMKQEFFETTVSFIVSANNNIKRIKGIIERLSSNYGQHIQDDIYSFPTAQELSSASVESIQQLGAGYRSAYIVKSSNQILSNQDLFSWQGLHNMQYADLKKSLEQLTGVGPKVADCIMLFSGLSTEAFPTDTWVKKIMEQLYIKKDVSKHYVEQYGKERFGKLAGYAQQYLFYYARSMKL